MSNKVKAIVDIDAEYFDYVHLYELFKERPAKQARFLICSVPVTNYSPEDPTFVILTCDTPAGWVKLFIPRSHVLLIEEGERFSETPRRIGFKEEAPEASGGLP